MSIEEQNQLLIQQNAVLLNTVQQLSQTIERLNQTIKELEEKLNKNSKNSSKPPSSDGLKKSAPKSLRTSSGKKPGAQDGHKGTNLSILEKPDETVRHMPECCMVCPRRGVCNSNACIGETRYVVDASVQVTVTAHESLVVHNCPLNGTEQKGNFPETVRSAVQYGENLQALAVAMNTYGAVSVNRTHEILSSVFGIPVSTGTISAMVSRCAEAVTRTVEEIREKVSRSTVVHFDETGTRVEGKTCWVHNASNVWYTYLTLHGNRGIKGMDASGVLPEYSGTAVHDCWSPYWKYEGVRHALCCAHLLRELTGIKENHPKQKWPEKFKKLLLDMKQAKEKAVESGKTGMDYAILQNFDRRYNALIGLAYHESPQPLSEGNRRGRRKKGKVRALIERLEKYKGAVCLFAWDFQVPFDNNQAERDIRMIKVKTKVSGCFRSMEGATAYLKVMSYLGTARKHGISTYKAIQLAIAGTPNLIFG